MVIGSANLNLFATKTINPPINNTKLALVTNIPPIEAIFVIPFKPFEDINVIKITKKKGAHY